MADLDFSRCLIPPTMRRRLFWSTQPNREDEECGRICDRMGQRFLDTVSGNTVTGRTIDTSDWVRGLAINILGTDGEVEASDCGVRPGLRGGHWSQSFSAADEGFGTNLRRQIIDCSIGEAAAVVEAILLASLSRLVTYGVARSVDVTARYLGRGQVEAEIEIVGESDGTTKVAITGSRIANAWVWN